MAKKLKKLKRKHNSLTGLLRMELNIVTQSEEDKDMGNWSVRCFCGWKGTLKECGIDWESEGWEYPSYQIATCPQCGEAVEI